MSKHYSKTRRLKYVFVAFACAASFSVTGLVAACKTDEPKEDEKTTSKEDTQLLKNGNFEFFNVPDKKEGENAPEYLINTPNSWTRGGSSSYTMSGIIGTSDEAWKKLTADDIAEKLDANNALDSSASDYKDKHVDYNGMKSSDLLYKNQFSALKYGTITSETEDEVTKYYIGDGDSKTQIYKSADSDDYFYDEGLTKPVSKDFIKNPGAHNIFKDESGKPYLLDDNGEKQEIFVDENGDYFLEYDSGKDEYRQPVGHVLMLHNYSNSNRNGISQNYASIDVSIPANTSAEISFWVKTSDLLYAGGKDANEDQNHGANVTVTHTAGSSTLDDFKITSINTEKLIGDGKYTNEYNGWIEYTVYINACNFASSNVSLKLGLGESDHLVEGYAFFDDVTVTKFVDLNDEACTYSQNKANFEKENAPKCDLTSDASEKIFVADTLERATSDGTVSNKRFSEDFHYLLDLASESGYKNVEFTNMTAGLTVDSDKYVSSYKSEAKTEGSFSAPDMLNVKLPDDLKNLKVDGTSGNGLDTRGDLLALVNAGYEFNSNHTSYYEKLNDELKTAPGDGNMLVLFSATGAAYTASFDIDVAKEEYKIISFWVKTSDMNGRTAATVKITENGKKENTQSVALDSTGIVTDIDDEHTDIYNGWVQCFFFVHNETDDSSSVHVEFSFGNTTLKGTTVTSYKAGWASLANVQSLTVDEDVFAYTGSGSHTASLTISEDEKKNSTKFDEAYGSQANEIENGIVHANSYRGYNGGSSKVVDHEVVSPFDDMDTNPNAGLINKEHFGNYAGQEWYNKLLTSFNASSSDAVANWNTVFGAKSVQPLIIVNSRRQDYVRVKTANEDNYKTYFYRNEDGDYVHPSDDDAFDAEKDYYTLQDVLNYGFVGSQSTVSSDGFATVSVRVKVSAGAIAYVYLVDDNTSKVLGFNAPSYTFYYDEDGNVLKAEADENASLSEQRENILYSLRDDGLYEDKDGKLYANTWNYTKLYKDETAKYYDKDGNAVNFDDLEEGETYYADASHSREANHFLVTGDGTEIYEFKDGKYHYIVSGATQDAEVTPFDVSYARYTYEGLSEQYSAVIEDTQGKWVTVNFVIHAGSASKSYRLELWSGARDEFETEGNTENGSVLFDYSYTSVSSDDMLNWYENEIIKAYQKILSDNSDNDNDLLSGVVSSTWNIGDYKKLVDKYIEEGKLTQADIDQYDILKNYTAHYYTYSLYDSEDFKPFNKNTANENATGYDYSVNNYDESLAYLAIMDKSDETETDGYIYTVFTDYSVINQSITLDNGGDEEEDEKPEEKKDTNSANVWLLASSIVLVIALLFAMIAIFVKDALKKKRRSKTLSKNNYNSNKANRYIRKLGIKKEEIEEVDAQNATEAPEETETTEANETTEAPEAVEPEQSETPADGDEPSEDGE